MSKIVNITCKYDLPTDLILLVFLLSKGRRKKIFIIRVEIQSEVPCYLRSETCSNVPGNLFLRLDIFGFALCADIIVLK